MSLLCWKQWGRGVSQRLNTGGCGVISLPSLELRVVFLVNGEAGWHRGVCDLASGIVATTSQTFSARDVVAIRHCPQRPGSGDRCEPYDRGREDTLGVMRDVAILLALMGGEDPALVMQMAKESVLLNGTTIRDATLEREEQKRLELLSASELHSVDEEEVLVGE